jgi:uncharacterized protein YjbJ (UPF0337 family)
MPEKTRTRRPRSFGGDHDMKPSTHDEIAANVHELKGKIKEQVGRATNNPRLEGEGIGENLTGKVQEKIGQVEKVIEKP